MEIRTKFKPKDEMWTISYQIDDRKTLWKVNKYPTKVAYIIIDDGITYYTMDMSYYNEINCFATKEEAQKECDRRNGNKGTND